MPCPNELGASLRQDEKYIRVQEIYLQHGAFLARFIENAW
jgi:hypothetical protein